MDDFFDIPDEYAHPDFNANKPDIIKPIGLQLAPLESVASSWTVKLKFGTSKGTATGSGWFVNIPGVDKLVILTAGHNLIDDTGRRTTDLAVLRKLTDKDGNEKHQWIDVADADIHICNDFLKQQTDVSDWGVVLHPLQPGDKKGIGFGYSIRLAYEKEIRALMYVTGYQADPLISPPVSSSGPSNGVYHDYLAYKAKTEQGISGSVVWIEFEGRPTAVAIHNHRPKRLGAGSRGTRLNIKVLTEVFEFVKAGYFGVSLKAWTTPKQMKQLPPQGLFLHFPPNFSFARVKLGSGTKVNVIPAEVSSAVKKYALQVGEKWALFNVGRQEIQLVDQLTSACLWTNGREEPDGSVKRTKEGKMTAKLVVESGSSKFQVKIRGERIREFDGEDAQSSEVSFNEYPADKVLFTDFSFE